MSTAGWTISIIGIAIALLLALRWERSSRRDQPGGGRRPET